MCKSIEQIWLFYCCPDPNCDREYKTKFNLKKHVEMTHMGLKFFVCEICSKSLSSKQVLDEHMNKHLGIKPHKCSICRQKFRHYSHLALHRRKHSSRFKVKNS